MLLDRPHLVTEFVDLLRDPLEILVFFVERVETPIDFLKLVMDRLELFADHAGDFLADYSPHVVFAEHSIFDEIDNVEDILGVLIHRSSAYHTRNG